MKEAVKNDTKEKLAERSKCKRVPVLWGCRNPYFLSSSFLMSFYVLLLAVFVRRSYPLDHFLSSALLLLFLQEWEGIDRAGNQKQIEEKEKKRDLLREQRAGAGAERPKIKKLYHSKTQKKRTGAGARAGEIKKRDQGQGKLKYRVERPKTKGYNSKTQKKISHPYINSTNFVVCPNDGDSTLRSGQHSTSEWVQMFSPDLYLCIDKTSHKRL